MSRIGSVLAIRCSVGSASRPIPVLTPTPRRLKSKTRLSSMEQLDQRRHARLGTEYLALFSGEKIRAQGQGVVLDLSVAGCRIRSPVEFTTGEYFGVVIAVSGYVIPLDVPLAVVRWSKGQECGMEFIQMEPDDRRRLRQLI